MTAHVKQCIDHTNGKLEGEAATNVGIFELVNGTQVLIQQPVLCALAHESSPPYILNRICC
jgi:hypothetical protein